MSVMQSMMSELIITNHLPGSDWMPSSQTMISMLVVVIVKVGIRMRITMVAMVMAVYSSINRVQTGWTASGWAVVE